ncbi:hypothetical protein L596_020559 [Steinernema carpocapsae]|uniref:G-protein coupled receptors family 1 profile domain-containing protein n=1 Tax=Steinernema carpocapsae TaxID=34508 RepID=A0A4U5MU32_STECR|nr:hypothetical protein L596_020559 [Steinernema carpocapsae]
MDPNGLAGATLMALTAITVVFYIYVIAIIILKKDLRSSPFYMLNVAMGITDIGNILTTYIFQRIAGLGFLLNEFYMRFGSYSALAVFCTNGFAVFNNAQKYFLLAIGLNRFTAVVMPSIHQRIWKPKNCLLIIVVITALNLIPSVVMEIISRSYYVIEACQILEIHVLNYNIYLSVAAALFAFVLYAFIILSLLINRQKFKAASSHNKKSYSVELKLTMSVLLHSVLLSADALTAAMIFIWKQRYFMQYNYVVQDLLSGCNPYLLLAFSSELRKRVLWWKAKSSASIVSVGSSISPRVTKTNNVSRSRLA